MNIAIVGLGYVGVQLAVALGRHFPTVGFDVNGRRVAGLRAGSDPTGEVSGDQLRDASRLTITADASDLAGADVFIVAVPTPVDPATRPDFGPLLAASATVGRSMGRGAIVCFESTVYPGATEEVCIPVLESESGLRWRQDFHVGYSPERINPGDRAHTLRSIVKVVAADDANTLDRLADIYGTVVEAGVYRAPSIRVAEAAKVIENTQRDLNIALVNELSIIFGLLGLDTADVLAAASTKWNFLPFRPGLVGGHCIGVDPYYLTYKAQMLGYHPDVILAGRRINDHMGKYVAAQTVKRMIAAGAEIKGGVVQVFGLTFKENCPDLRNSQVIPMVRELESFGLAVHVHDPWADPEEALEEYGIGLVSRECMPRATTAVLAVAHDRFLEGGIDALVAGLDEPRTIIDVKSVLDRDALARAGVGLWRL